jgi:hypothetical protein
MIERLDCARANAAASVKTFASGVVFELAACQDLADLATQARGAPRKMAPPSRGAESREEILDYVRANARPSVKKFTYPFGLSRPLPVIARRADGRHQPVTTMKLHDAMTGEPQDERVWSDLV